MSYIVLSSSLQTMYSINCGFMYNVNNIGWSLIQIIANEHEVYESL
jgi:hypothetical protein